MKILIPIDFSENSIRALELVLQLNGKQKSTIILVHIVELIHDFASQAAIALDSMRRDAKKLLAEIEKNYQAEHLEFKTVIEEGTASISVARIADKKKVDLIAIGTSGAGGLKKLVMGSSTKNLLKETNSPVLVVPANASMAKFSNLTMAIQYANHEKPLIDSVISFSRTWNLELDFLHVQTEDDFKGELASLGLVAYLKQKYQLNLNPISNIASKNVNEALQQHFKINTDGILVMCHQHKSFWEEFQESSRSLALVYQSTVPILVMN